MTPWVRLSVGGSAVAGESDPIGVGPATAGIGQFEDSSRRVMDHPYLSWIDYAVLGAYLLGMLGFG